MAARLHRLRSSRRGSILVIVMWMSLGLITVALYFGHAISFEYKAVDNSVSDMQAAQAIDGAMRYIQYVLAQAETPGVLPDLENAEYVAEAVPVADATFWLCGRDLLNAEYPSTPVFGLVDESSKININTYDEEADPNPMLAILEALPILRDRADGAEIAAAIVDWRDEDSDESPDGAESDWYEQMSPPYSPKNDVFESIDELRLVRGVTTELLYGEDVNRNGVLDANEDDGDASWPPDNDDGVLDPGLAEYLTCWTRQPNEDGSAYTVGKVNVRTASAAVLSAVIAGATGQDNMDDMGGDLVATRATLEDSELEDAGMQWVADVVGQDSFPLVQPFLTNTGNQYSADVTAVGHAGRGFRRAFIVFDVEGEVRVIYRRDTTRAGWPLGADLRKELKTAGSATTIR